MTSSTVSGFKGVSGGDLQLTAEAPVADDLHGHVVFQETVERVLGLGVRTEEGTGLLTSQEHLLLTGHHCKRATLVFINSLKLIKREKTKTKTQTRLTASVKNQDPNT